MYCVAMVDMCHLNLCCMFCVVVKVSVLGIVEMGEVGGYSVG